MNKDTIVKDERYYAVENASYKIGWIILAFGVFVLIFIRSLLFNQSNWDFFALVFISSLATTIYQIKNKIIGFSRKWVILFFAVMVFSAILVFVINALKN